LAPPRPEPDVPAVRHVFRGAALQLQGDAVAPEVLLSGPAGTGKSLACLAKMHALAQAHPGFRGLIVRKTRESLTESTLVTFERDVLLPCPRYSYLAGGANRQTRHAYRYPNGSEIIISGLPVP